MDYNQEELNNTAEDTQSNIQDAPSSQRKPLYVYQRIRSEGPGYSHKEKSTRSIKEQNHHIQFSFSLPRIEKTQYGKFTLSAGAVMIMAINLIALGRIASNAIYIFAGKLLYFLHLDSIPFDKFTFSNLQIFTTYMLSFILGGMVFYLLLKILSVFSEHRIIFQVGHILRLILALFLFLFAFITLIKLMAGYSLYDTNVLPFMAPLSVYLCCIIVCLFSKTNIVAD